MVSTKHLPNSPLVISQLCFSPVAVIHPHPETFTAADVMLESKTPSLITYKYLQLHFATEPHRRLRNFKRHCTLITAWIQGCIAVLLCRRSRAGRQMEELMMSFLPRKRFMMSSCDTFLLVGLFQVICDFGKCQGGDRRAVGLIMELMWIHNKASISPPHWIPLVLHRPMYVKKFFFGVQYGASLKFIFHIINLLQFFEHK